MHKAMHKVLVSNPTRKVLFFLSLEEATRTKGHAFSAGFLIPVLRPDPID